jgi:hypothetical protein
MCSYQEAAMRLLTRIEAIPLSTMEKGLPWDWESFPQWMARRNGTG